MAAGPEFTAMIALLRTKHHGRALRSIRRLHALFLDYPIEILRGVLVDAVDHKAHDLVQIESLVLRRAGTEIFRFPLTPGNP